MSYKRSNGSCHEDCVLSTVDITVEAEPRGILEQNMSRGQA
jgi:hypothetical protein